jgi:hypothetical protein
MWQGGFNAWTVTTVLAVAGAGVLGSRATKANASAPPVDADEGLSVAPIDRTDDEPPFGSFLGACDGDSDCPEGNTCSAFRKRGNHCTHPCETAEDCGGGYVARCTKQHRCGLDESESGRK